MFRTTIRGLRAHKLRLVAAALSVVLGVALMAGTLVLTDTVGRSFDELYATVGSGTDALVRSTAEVDSAQGGKQHPPVEASVVDTARATPGVEHAEGNVTGYAQFVDRNGKAIGNPGQGAPTLGMNWPDDPRLNPFTLVEGTAPTAADEVAMDKASARTGGFAVGDRVTVLTKGEPVTLTVAGIVTFGGADSPLGASIALLPTPVAQELVGTPGKFDSVSVVATNGVAQSTVVASLNERLPDGIGAITGDQAVHEQQEASRKGLGFFTTFLLTFALIALFVGSFIIYNSFSISVAQRTRELALLRAVGASRRQVRTAVVLEALAVGVVASAVGVLAGIGTAVGLEGLFGVLGFDIPTTTLVVEPGTLATAFAVGLVVTVVAAWLPARRAGRVAPMAALRDVAVDTAGRSTVRLIAGLAVGAVGVGLLTVGLVGGGDGAAGTVGLGAAVTFLAVAVLGPLLAVPVGRLLGAPLAATRGVTGRLARSNAVRNPRRTSATASALMIGVALVAFITVFAGSGKASIDHIVDRSFRGDVIVDSGTQGMGLLSPELARRIEAIPEVEQVTEIRLVNAKVGGEAAMLVAIDPQGASKVADLEVQAGALESLGVDDIAVSRRKADAKGWQLDDEVPVAFASGTAPLRIAAIYGNADLGGDSFVSLAAQEAHDTERLDLQLYVAYRDGADAVAARSAIDAATADYPTAQVQDLTEFKAAQARPIDQMLTLIYALLLLAVVIALIGIANTMALSIHERTRELGLLRAVGMTRRQLRATVRQESMIIALFGTALGLAVGVCFGWALVRALGPQGITELVVPAGQLAVVTALAALAGVAAGILPARRAARLDVLGAVTSE